MFRKLFLFLIQGKKYSCNICNSNWRFFNKVGLNSNATKINTIIGAGLRFTRCWKCGSVERERLLMHYINKIVNPEKLAVLHIAPERVIKKKVENLFLKYITGDIEKKEDIEIQVDITNMKVFDDETFDLLICNHVLEHITDDANAISEIHRVLKKNGKAILNVPIYKNLYSTYYNPDIIDPNDREFHYGQFDHVRIYGQDFFDKVESFGFKKMPINYPSLTNKLKLNPDEFLFQFIKN